MTANIRRTLDIDDPLAPHDAVPRGTLPDSRLRDVPLGDIHPNPSQPRKRFDQQSLVALAESIGERGVLQPIIVRPRDEGGFHLVAGERRWRASRLAELATIPALVDEQLNDAVSLELALIENMVRRDLTAIEEARTIAMLLDDLDVTRSDLARRLGRSRSDLAHTVRLLELPDDAIDLIDSGALSKGHGKALLTEPDHARCRPLARDAVASGWSVRKLEAEISRGRSAERIRLEPNPDQQAFAARFSDLLGRAIGSDVRFRPHRDGYSLILDRAAAERLADLCTGA